MTKFMLLSFIVFLNLKGIAQSLEGDWIGTYEDNYYANLPAKYNSEKSTKITLKFLLNKDSSYSVFSFTTGLPPVRLDTVVICKMAGQITKDSVYLEEVQVILPEDYPARGFQKMFLKIKERKKIIELTGTWKGDSESSGSIYFYKKKAG